MIAGGLIAASPACAMTVYQRNCSSYLGSTQMVSDTVAFSDVALYQRVDSVLWLAVEDRRSRIGHEPSNNDASILRLLSGEAGQSQQLARVFSPFLAGLKGSEMSRAASFYYGQLDLPPGPALAVVLNRRNGALGRSLALRSIASSRSSAWFEDVLLFLACDLNERTIGRSEHGRRLGSILDYDEMALARETAVFFAASNVSLDMLVAIIGADSPLSSFFREARGYNVEPPLRRP